MGLGSPGARTANRSPRARGVPEAPRGRAAPGPRCGRLSACPATAAAQGRPSSPRPPPRPLRRARPRAPLATRAPMQIPRRAGGGAPSGAAPAPPPGPGLRGAPGTRPPRAPKACPCPPPRASAAPPQGRGLPLPGEDCRDCPPALRPWQPRRRQPSPPASEGHFTRVIQQVRLRSAPGGVCPSFMKTEIPTTTTPTLVRRVSRAPEREDTAGTPGEGRNPGTAAVSVGGPAKWRPGVASCSRSHSVQEAPAHRGQEACPFTPSRTESSFPSAAPRPLPPLQTPQSALSGLTLSGLTTPCFSGRSWEGC